MTENKSLIEYAFNGNQIQVVMIENEPWFVAKEVCDALGIANSRDAVSGLDDDEKSMSAIPTPAGNRDMTIVSEPGLYGLILKSRKPEAKMFKRWIKHEVLPSIRKTGSYQIQTLTPAELIHQQSIVLVDHERQLADHQKQITEMQEAVKRIESGQNSGELGYMTVKGMANIKGMKLTVLEASAIGKKASKICQELGIDTKKVPDQMYGQVNAYPIDVLEDIFNEQAA